jgi:hypothetical protein
MGVETATKVEDLNSSWPLVDDPVSRGDDHLRLIKSTLLYTFNGASSSGCNNFNVVTQSPGTNTTLAASTAFVSAAIAAASFSSVLPSQTGNAGKFITTNGTSASWGSVPGADMYLAANFGGF